MKSLLALTLGALCISATYVSLVIFNNLHNTYLEYFENRPEPALVVSLRGEWTAFSPDCTGNMDLDSTSSKLNYLVTKLIQRLILHMQMKARSKKTRTVLKPITELLSILLIQASFSLEPLLVHSLAIAPMVNASTLPLTQLTSLTSLQEILKIWQRHTTGGPHLSMIPFTSMEILWPHTSKN